MSMHQYFVTNTEIKNTLLTLQMKIANKEQQ